LIVISLDIEMMSREVLASARKPGNRTSHSGNKKTRVSAFLPKAEEGVIGKLIVESVILLSASKQSDGGKILRAAAQAYKVDTDAIALKVKHEFAAKQKARSAAKIEPKTAAKASKAAA